MTIHWLPLLVAAAAIVGAPGSAGAQAKVPDLSVNWIAGGGRTTFNEYQFTEA